MPPFPRLLIILLCALALFTAACSDDAGTASSAAGASTTAGPSTAPPATDATVATTTTAAPTTTVTPDTHPTWELAWNAVWPEDGAAATYRLTPPNQAAVDLPAVITYSVEWAGGTWDRIQIGSSEPGEYGLAFYFDRSEPWALRLWGLRANGPGMGPEGWITEYLGDAPVVDLNGLPGDAPTLDVDAFVDSGQDEIFGPTGAIYAMEVVGPEALEVAAGAFDPTLHLRFGLGGPFFGVDEGEEITFFSDLWVDSTQLILRWDPVPGFGGALELVTPWE